MFKLLIADDEGKTTVVPLVRDEITIGRKEGNTIRLTERNISRKHAKLRRSNGAFMLEDLSSYNGVKVNGKKIGNETTLQPGDQILIGDYQLALQLEGESATATIPEQTAPTGAPVANDAVTAMISAPAPSYGPPARLVMMSPPAPGAEYALSRDRMRIGRAEDLEIWVNHRSISREHAEVVNEGGKLFIRDLASANGLRVNNGDTHNHELKPGDVVELGQVRFRFVPAGEAFTFDEGRTMQMDALVLPADRDGPNRTAMYVGGGIVCVALLAGAAILFSGGTPDGPSAVALPPTSVSVTAPPPQTSVAVAADPDAAASAAIAACSTALNSGQFDDAIAHATTALALRPGDQSAMDCQARATSQRDEGATFAAGLAHMGNGDYEAAYVAFESLPVDSAYRARPEVAETMTQTATEWVTQAEGLATANPTEANRLAATVLVMTGVEPTLIARAQAVERTTHPRGVAIARTPPVRVGPRLVPTPPPATTRVAAPPPTTTARVAPPPPTTSAAAAPSDDRLNQCVIAGDNHCVVDLLGNGHAHTTAQLRMLFNAQRALSMRPAACATARQLISAPGVTPAQQSQYRQYQAAQCQ